MKLPNGFGSVYKLSGNRRKPYVAQKTTGYDSDAKRLYTIIGYYETREEGLIALAEYNKNPYSLQSKMTFAEVYEKWSERKFENISRSNINGYKASYKLCDRIKDLKMIDIKLLHLQSVVDNSGKNYPTLKKLKIMLSQVFDYAVLNDIIGKDHHKVEFLDIGKPTKSDKHYRFTDDEIKVLWNWSEKPDNIYVRLILMLIYSGVRPGELFNVKRDRVNLEERSFYIDKGKNDNAVRKVPIHEKVYPFFKQWHDKGTEYLITQLNGRNFRFDTNHAQYVDSYWTPLLQDMGILQYTNDKGITKEHTPDDTRHTFTTMWHEKQLDEAMRRKIQGHSGKGIGEQVYSHIEFEKLKAELNKL
ncbi:MAG: tyrosine-type recombinase/integrase [Oscillospiraceae bacterium]|nr:tyrosine-type recombinase/integrase [Oscillospiraceae bacterium]